MTARARDPRGRFQSAGAASQEQPVGDTAGERFLTELRASWAQHGATTIELVRTERPHDYLRLIAANLPKAEDGRADPFDRLTDDEIADELRRILDELAAAGAIAGA